MDIRFIYKKIFEDLFANKKGLQIYTLHRRYGLSPSKAIDFINEYSPAGIVSVEDGTSLLLTAKGRDNIRNIIADIFKDNDFTGLTYLSRLLFSPIDKYAPYIPQSVIPGKESKIEIIDTPEWEDIMF